MFFQIFMVLGGSGCSRALCDPIFESFGIVFYPLGTFFHTSFAFFFDSIPFGLPLVVHWVLKTITFPSKGAWGEASGDSGMPLWCPWASRAPLF